MGKFLASVLMILGYGIIAVPTGIISAEMVQSRKKVDVNTRVCAECLCDKHKDNAIFCHQCGSHQMMTSKKLIYIAGPTGIGKTELSIAIAKS